MSVADSPAQAHRSPPLFIVGCGRSGTTMLRLMFDSHPEVAIPDESHFIIHKYRSREREIRRGELDVPKLISQILASRHFEKWGLSQEVVLEELAKRGAADFSGAISLLYETYAAQQGKVRWGDKTPEYVRSVNVLGKLFPSAQFIHVIRDGRDVALSYLSVPWGPTSIWEAANKWKVEVELGREGGQRLGPDRYIEVHYEGLVSNPTAELTRLCDFVNLRFDLAMLDFYVKALQRDGIGAQKAFRRSETLPANGPVRDWATQMIDKEILEFEAVAGTLLEDLGYVRRFNRVPFGLRFKCGLRRIGADVRTKGSQLMRLFRSKQLATTNESIW